MPSSSLADDRIVTVPNALSVVRLLLVPVFLWLLLVKEADGWAVAVLMFSGFSDWLDGKLARLLGQYSKLGAFLDPAADRIYLIVIPIGFALRDIMPWWFVILLIGRDLVLFSLGPTLRKRGIIALPVLYIGKAATFALMYGFPLVLAGQFNSAWGNGFFAVGWAFTIWGAGMYLWSLVLYLMQTVKVVVQLPAVKTRPKIQTLANSQVQNSTETLNPKTLDPKTLEHRTLEHREVPND